MWIDGMHDPTKHYNKSWIKDPGQQVRGQYSGGRSILICIQSPGMPFRRAGRIINVCVFCQTAKSVNINSVRTFVDLQYKRCTH